MSEDSKKTRVKIELVDVRLSFPRLYEARAFEEGQTARYEATFLLDPTREDHQEMIKKLKAEAARVATEKWGDKWKRPSFLKGKCFGTEASLTEIYDGYEGMFWVRTAKVASDGRPLVVDRDKTPLTEADGKPYAGCYVQATLSLWCQDNKFGRRINANLRGVRFLRDGDAFSANAVADADDEFSDVAGDPDNADFDDDAALEGAAGDDSFLDD